MARGNDAIPSWSGFNYQGKISLLCILETINSIKDQSTISDYWYELEKTEDLVIGKLDTVTALYQVKAILSRPDYLYYIEDTYDKNNKMHFSVTQKLVNHKMERGNLDADCYLVSAIEIKDWSSSNNKFSKAVKLYTHNNEIVGICDVKRHIEAEIENFCTRNEIAASKDHIAVIYGDLCVLLDEQVARMHKAGADKRKYAINFADITKSIVNSNDTIKNRVEFLFKETIYDFLSERFVLALSTHCQEQCYDNHLTCKAKCSVHCASNEFTKLGSVWEYIRIINPSISANWRQHLEYVEHASKENIANHILYPLCLIKDPSLIKSENGAILFGSLLSKSQKGNVIPTLLDLTSSMRNGPVSLQKTFQGIKDNSYIRQAIDGNSLLANMPKVSSNALTEEAINSAWRSNAVERVSEQEKISDFYANTEILSEQSFLEEMKKNA